jgi:hypothetical protein
VIAHRYRLYPAPDQQPVLEKHWRDARTVWNAALEQFNYCVRAAMRPRDVASATAS